jgi:hypothetical protein
MLVNPPMGDISHLFDKREVLAAKTLRPLPDIPVLVDPVKRN